MRDDANKAIVICTVFILMFALFLAGYRGGGDYNFHFAKAQGDCEKYRNCDNYAPLFHFIAGPFSFHENAFFYFALFLLAFVTPMLLYLITKDWIVTWFYFSTTSYFWFFIDGLFAQATAMILLLLVIYFKDWRLQAAVVVLAATAHGHGFLLCLVAFICIRLGNIIENGGLGWGIAKFLPACSGTFGKYPPEILNQPIDGMITTGVEFRVSNAIIPFTKIFPFPIMIVCVMWVWRKKEHIGLLLIAGFALVAGFKTSHRAFYVIPLVLLPIFTKWYRSTTGWWKKGTIAFTIIFFFYELYSWLNYKLVCT